MKLIFLSFFLVLAGIYVQAQTKLSLKAAIDLGLRNNLQVNEAGFDMQSEEIYLKQMKARMLPDLNATLNYGINHGRSIDPFTNSFINQNVTYSNYGATSNLLLYRGGALKNSIKANQTGYEAAKMEWQQAKDNVTINIILSYLQILSAEEVLEQSRQQGLVTDRQIERLALLNKEGVISPSLYFDVKGQGANDQIAIADNEAALANAKLSLQQLLNVPYDKTFEVEKLPEEDYTMNYTDTPETIYQKALESFAQVKAANLRTLSAERSVRAAQGQLFPTLSLGGNIYTNYSSAASRSVVLNRTAVPSEDYVEIGGDKIPVIIQKENYQVNKIDFGNQLNNNLFNTINLSLNIPLFNAAYAKNNIRLAKVDYKRKTIIEENTKLELRQSIEKSWLSLTNSLTKYKLLQEQVEAFAESFRAAEIRFEAGDITSVDYLVAKNNLDRSRIDLIVSKYDFILRSKILDYYKGER